MEKFTFILFTIAFILGACAPQATATPEATLTPTPPPTEPPIPTPTFHPQFAALQEQISASGGRFTLNPDGTISEGAESIPGLTVAPDGTMTLTVDGETVKLDPTKAVFDDEAGFSYPGYEQNADGNWVEAISPEMKQMVADVNNLVTVLETFELGESDANSVVLMDKASGEEKFRFIVGEDGSLTDPKTEEKVYRDARWHLPFMRTTIGEGGNCKVTPWHGSEIGPSWQIGEHTERFLKDVIQPLADYVQMLVKIRSINSFGTTYSQQYLGNNCWAIIPVTSAETSQTESYIFWKDGDGRPKYIPIFFETLD